MTTPNSEMTTYLRTLISEKGVDSSAPIAAFEEVGHIGLCYDHLIDFIDGAPAHEQQAIRNQLVMLDFKAADIFDFLNYLINVMIKVTGMNEYGGFVTTKHGPQF